MANNQAQARDGRESLSWLIVLGSDTVSGSSGSIAVGDVAVITGKAASESAFGDIPIGRYFMANAALTLKEGDSCIKCTLAFLGQATGKSVEESKNVADMTIDYDESTNSVTDGIVTKTGTISGALVTESLTSETGVNLVKLRFGSIAELDESGTITYKEADTTAKDVLMIIWNARNAKVGDLLEAVNLPRSYMTRYPNEFSGGQRQRIGIARALSVSPELIICDEAVSALDVSIQAQVLKLLKELQEERSLTYIFITHDLSVVEYVSDRIAVMYLGKVVELAETDELFRDTIHPYTKALLSAIPIADITKKRKRIPLQGDVPSPVNPPSGCPFHPRCSFCQDRCRTEIPVLRRLEGTGKEHYVCCHRAEEFLAEIEGKGGNA